MNIRHSSIYASIYAHFRAINGVKDMDGFRETFDIDTNTPDNSSSSECSDDVGDGTILVSTIISVHLR